ncbi:PRTRC system protein C [Deinococcus sp. 14RED07]|uniref:PRTRC system protein C n=1 Tax=unclassified Deinococcus TaxID=2623546 RepID=UPI001E37B160|nr:MULTISPECIES: PRTRC system protein C [unclassified Deinococcus]MCD0160700.1 PRTRC system protein C [Deinococcus sp. 6YEL10]MCD0165114.1 PRTRC system protein C [Deinococcus sp. 12RED42]MCD0175124.1 PRTRC system protein C [Deinococcus sp. 14RED07]
MTNPTASGQPQDLTRKFEFDGHTLADPNPKMTPEQVKQFYVPTHPELTTAGIGSPVTDLKAGTITITFIKNYGRKG